MNKNQLKAMLASYARSVLGAAIALYAAGVTDPVKLVWALVAALVPVATRALNPNDKAFGVLPSTEDVAVAVSKANVKDGEKLAKTVKKEVASVTKKPVARKTATTTTPKKK